MRYSFGDDVVAFFVDERVGGNGWVPASWFGDGGMYEEDEYCQIAQGKVRCMHEEVQTAVGEVLLLLLLLLIMFGVGVSRKGKDEIRDTIP